MVRLEIVNTTLALAQTNLPKFLQRCVKHHVRLRLLAFQRVRVAEVYNTDAKLGIDVCTLSTNQRAASYKYQSLPKLAERTSSGLAQLKLCSSHRLYAAVGSLAELTAHQLPHVHKSPLHTQPTMIRLPNTSRLLSNSLRPSLTTRPVALRPACRTLATTADSASQQSSDVGTGQKRQQSHAVSNPTLANIEKRWEAMPPQEQAELWMALRDRMTVDWHDMTMQEKRACE